MTKHRTKFINNGRGSYSFSSGKPRFRLRVPAMSETVSDIPEELYTAIMEDIGQPKYSHIRVIEPETEESTNVKPEMQPETTTKPVSDNTVADAKPEEKTKQAAATAKRGRKKPDVPGGRRK